MGRSLRTFGASVACIVSCVCATSGVAAEPPPTRDETVAAMKRAAVYWREKVAVHGGYVYHYSLDLNERWGEGPASPTQIWVQAPGTPVIGTAFLSAYLVTNDPYYLDAAREVGAALIHGQLASGGWQNKIDFDPQSRDAGNYRRGGGRKKGDNNSTLDDGITQYATHFLVFLDYTLKFEDETIHEATLAALNALLAAQFSNGAFPQVWDGPVAPQPILPASYPDYDWRTEGKVKEYWDRYTLNDGVAGAVTKLLLAAYQVYGDDRYRQALVKLGDFLLLAQMPEPQPAWCQQYGYDMKPIWARKFEPPAVSGGESQDVLEALLLIANLTDDDKYAAPIPRALAYLKKSQLSDGRLARYYELQTNKPLYMQRRGDVYELTYDDSDLPAHYGWKVDSRLSDIERAYELRNKAFGAVAPDHSQEARRILHALDDEGRWVSTYSGERLVGQPKFAAGMQYLSSDVFARNLTNLVEYLAANNFVR